MITNKDTNKEITENKNAEAALRSILVEQFEIADDLIKPETSLEEDLGLDSLQQVELLDTIKKKFNIFISRREELKTYGQLVNKFILAYQG
ncbi:MAG: phosphopantetheine-binding protein [bacterium]